MMKHVFFWWMKIVLIVLKFEKSQIFVNADLCLPQQGWFPNLGRLIWIIWFWFDLIWIIESGHLNQIWSQGPVQFVIDEENWSKTGGNDGEHEEDRRRTNKPIN